MRILHVDESFHPSFGYQSNPLAKFQQSQGHEVFIATVEEKWMCPVYKSFGKAGIDLAQEDNRYMTNTGVKVIRVPAKGYLANRLVYGREIFRVVNQVKPDVLFVHCVETLTGMRFLMNRHIRKNYPMMFDSHMLAMASNNKFAKLYEKAYRVIFTRIIQKNGYEVVRTQDDDYVNTHLGMPESQTPFISFGTDTMLFYPSTEERNKFRKENGISQDAFVVVYTGKLSKDKNGKLLATAFKEKFATPVTLVCVGTPPDDEYGKEVKEIFAESENQVIMFPTQNYNDLAKFYQAADLSVFPKQCSLSFYDAQACGLPVLSEANNVNVDRCAHGNGMNFIPDDAEDFRKKIIAFAEMPLEEREKMSVKAREFIDQGYSYENISAQYTEGLNRAIASFKKRKNK